MLTTQAYTIASLLAGASLVNAHGYVYSWTVNGKTERGASAARDDWGPADRDTASAACGGAAINSQPYALDAGSEVIATWSGPNTVGNKWPEEHHGPVQEYMAMCPGSSCSGVAPESLDWFKIESSTWDGSEWPTAAITRDEPRSFSIPSDIAPGAYLVRTEIIAMHFDWNYEGGIRGFEVYPFCFSAEVSSSGSAAPSDTATFPGIFDPSNYEWYDYSYRNDGPGDGRDPADYVPPGPAVYSGGGASAPSSGSGGSNTSAPASGSSVSASNLPSPTEVETAPTNSPSEPETPAEGEEESMPTTAPAASSGGSGSGSGSSAATSRTRGGWWKNWRGSKTSSAAQVTETEATEEDEEEEGGEEEYKRRRSVLGRHAARKLAAF